MPEVDWISPVVTMAREGAWLEDAELPEVDWSSLVAAMVPEGA